MNTNHVVQENKQSNNKLFYIDKKINHIQYIIVKVNYKLFLTMSYEDITDNVDLFYNMYIQHNYKKKIIIIIDIQVVKNILHNNNVPINKFNIINNIYLINLIKYIGDNYDEYIFKCLLVHYSGIDKQLILLCKHLLKSIQFMNKVEPFLQNS